MEKTINEAFGTQFGTTAGWFVDKVMPEECLKIRVGMGEAVLKEINDRINYLNIPKIRSQIDQINEKNPTSEDALERKIILVLRQEFDNRFSEISTELSKASKNPLESTIKSLLDEHLKIIQEECDKQKNEINELLQHDSLLKRIEQQDKRLLKFQRLLFAQFGLLVLMALFLFRNLNP